MRPRIEEVKKRWANERTMPSGYYYVFPVNYISNDLRDELETFKNEYKGLIDINYYDCDQMQKLIKNLEKLSDMKSLVDYIKQIWKG